MQRPFVWDSSKVRDLVDSLYKGFPVGYIIVWQNPDVKLKDGTKSSGKKVLIDGQQRITAMAAAIVGQEVLDGHYKWKRISIAFNPVEEKFEVANNAILKSSKWIPDIAPVLEPALGDTSRGGVYVPLAPPAMQHGFGLQPALCCIPVPANIRPSAAAGNGLSGTVTAPFPRQRSQKV